MIDFWGVGQTDGLVGRGARKFDTALRVVEVGRNICFGGGKGGGSSAPAADPNIGKAALMQAKTGDDWLAFAKEQFVESNKRQDVVDKLTGEVTTQQLSDMRKSSDRSDTEWSRYNNLFKPVEDRMVSDANNYDTPEAQAAAAATAKADVMSNADSARLQNTRQMSAMGIAPGSGRFAGVDRANDLSTALAAAGAQNDAREQVKATGMALREGVANFGKGATSTAAQQVGLGLQAGNSAAGNQLGAESNFRANGQIMSQGFAGAQQGYAGQASTLNQQYGNQLQAKSISNQSSQANTQNNMAIAGTVGTLALAF